jgi:DNA invertase Pin-like site-specific DNA recombinase
MEETAGLQEAISYVRAGDTLVVWKLDRLGRSLRDLITRITKLNDGKIGFKSLTEQIDTTTSRENWSFTFLGRLRNSSGTSSRSERRQGWRQPGREGSVEDGQRHSLRRGSSWPEGCMRIRAHLLQRFARCWEFRGIRYSGM